MDSNQNDKTPGQVRAELRWALVCERLGFVLDPPPGASPEGATSDLAAALENVRAALEELQIAFGADEGRPPVPGV